MIAYTPARTEAAFDGLVPASFEFIEQRGDGLGERLVNVGSDLLSMGFESVAMMNSDSPTIPPAILGEAIAHLARPGDRVAIVGADDGGYCLIGLKRPHWRIFENITWSTGAVFAQTMERVAELSLEVARMPSWYDIDDAASLRRLVSELFYDRHRGEAREFHGNAESPVAPATRAWLKAALASGLANRLTMS